MKMIKKILVLATLVFAVTSCDLDEYPQSSFNEERIDWTSVAQYSKLRTGVYGLYKGLNGGSYTTTSDLQSDLFNATTNFGNAGGDLHRWDFTSSQFEIEKIWKFNYKLIGNINVVLNNIEKAEPVTENEVVFIQNMEGELHLLRAIAYHTLALRFAKDYNKATADKDLGLPLVQVFDESLKPSRGTVAETYLLIEQDIAKAQELIKAPAKSDVDYLTQGVVHAFAARVALSMQAYEEAIAYAQKVVDAYPLVEAASFQAMWSEDSSSEIIFKNFASADEAPNSFSLYLAYQSNTKRYNPSFVPTQYVVDLFEENDVRKDVFLRKEPIQAGDIKVDDVYMLSKYPGNTSLETSKYQYRNMYKPFRVAEQYLILAEAYYQLKDEQKAVEWLNKLREARGAAAIKVKGEALFTAIQDEWVREFVGEGMRLDQLKRWGVEMNRKANKPQNSQILESGSTYTDLVIPAGHYKFVWEVPFHDIDSNSNIELNWDLK